MARPSSPCFRDSLLVFLPSLLLLNLPTQPVDAFSQASLRNCPIVPAELASTHFNVLVPNRTSFKQLLDCSLGSQNVKGFAVDVFEAARSILPPHDNLALYANVTYHCFDVSSGRGSFDEMVDCLSVGSFDAVVGDVTITADRMTNASFTLPYLEAGMVLLAPAVGKTSKLPGILFSPFTTQMWRAICGFAVLAGYVLWSLELNGHPEFRRGQRKQQIEKGLWFISLLLVFVKRDTTKNPLSKIVLISWLGFVLLLSSTYVATLSAILTVQKLSPQHLTMSNLQNGSIVIGYRNGTRSEDYLKETLNIQKSRLVSLTGPDNYAKALSEGRVAAIMDEAPYVNLFLSGLPAASCVYLIVNASSKLTSEGFGFAFPTSSNSDIAVTFSTAILNLSANGQLLKLQTGATLNDYQCPTKVQSTQLDLKELQGVLLFLGLTLVMCIGIGVARLMRRYIQNRNFPRIKVHSEKQGNDLCQVDVFVDNNFFRKFEDYTYDSSPHRLSMKEAFS